jgi:hypothetical protein
MQLYRSSSFWWSFTWHWEASAVGWVGILANNFTQGWVELNQIALDEIHKTRIETFRGYIWLSSRILLVFRDDRFLPT